MKKNETDYKPAIRDALAHAPVGRRQHIELVPFHAGDRPMVRLVHMNGTAMPVMLTDWLDHETALTVAKAIGKLGSSLRMSASVRSKKRALPENTELVAFRGRGASMKWRNLK
jgi:hypothetical protein